MLEFVVGLFSATHMQQIVTAVDNNSDDGQSEKKSSESCGQFCQWVTEFVDELTQQLVAPNTKDQRHFSDVGHTEDSNTFPALVDDILSLIYGEVKYQSLRKSTSALLLRRDGVFELAVQGLFRLFVEQKQHWLYNLHVDHDVDILGNQLLEGSSSTSSDLRYQHFALKNSDDRDGSSGGWNRRWFLEPPPVSATPLSGNTYRSSGDRTLSSIPSLLSVVTLLRLFVSVDVSLHGLEFTLGAAITDILHKSPTISGPKLLLDGVVHSLDTFPSGLSTLAGALLLGECWSVYQYEGSRLDDGSSIDLLLIALPASPNQTLDKPLQRAVSREARRIRVRMDLDEMLGRGEDRFSIFAEVSSAREKLQYAGEQSTGHDFVNVSSWGWSPTMEVHATYIGAATPSPGE